ncbi:MAG: hypothetical protein ABMA13_17875 [Chthoniobacteraceae bacterium]
MTADPYAGIIRSARRRPLWEAKASTREVAIGRDAIGRILPHRDPALMLDEITAIDLDQQCIRAIREVSVDDPGFAGHFPGEPVFPAFRQFEIAGQAGICLLDFVRRHSHEVPANLQPRRVRPIKAHHGVLLAEIHPGDSLTALAKILVDDELTSIFAAQLLTGDILCSLLIVEVCFADP